METTNRLDLKAKRSDRRPKYPVDCEVIVGGSTLKINKNGMTSAIPTATNTQKINTLLPTEATIFTMVERAGSIT